MRDIVHPPQCEDFAQDSGCAYIIDDDDRRSCGAARQASSSYCAYHHSLCYIVSGSTAEDERLREVEALASAVGGRSGRRGTRPSRQFLRRLELTLRGSP
jgi:hypothetical protein